MNRVEYFSWTAKKMDPLREGRREGMKEGAQTTRTTDIERMADYILSHNDSFTREQALAEATACLSDGT